METNFSIKIDCAFYPVPLTTRLSSQLRKGIILDDDTRARRPPRRKQLIPNIAAGVFSIMLL